MQLRRDCRATRASATEAATITNDAEAAASTTTAKAAEHGGEEQRGANGYVKRKGCAAKCSAAVRPRGGKVAAARRHRRGKASEGGKQRRRKERNRVTKKESLERCFPSLRTFSLHQHQPLISLWTNLASSFDRWTLASPFRGRRDARLHLGDGQVARRRLVARHAAARPRHLEPVVARLEPQRARAVELPRRAALPGRRRRRRPSRLEQQAAGAAGA